MPEPHEVVTIDGGAAAVEEALRSITLRLLEAPNHHKQSQARTRALAAKSLPVGEKHTKVLNVAGDQVGSIIGKGGANIRQIRAVRSSARTRPSPVFSV